MARQDAGKQVSRVGSTGGGRTYRARVPYRWYSGLALIVVIGTFLVVYSRYELLHPVAAPPAGVPTTSDHWVAGLSFDICGDANQTLAASPALDSEVLGFYSSGKGIIQVQPKSSSQAGANATLGKFTSSFKGLTLTASTIGLPKKHVYTNGSKCLAGTPDAGKTGELVAWVWPTATAPSATTQSGDVRTVHFSQTTQVVAVGFLPSGATIPRDLTLQTGVVEAEDEIEAAEQATTTTLPVTSTTLPVTSTTKAGTTTSTTTAGVTTTTSAGTTTTTG
jgi:hypothetical protein